MLEVIIFALATVGIIYVSRASLRMPGSHGFYRFFAWEVIVALFLLNVEAWLGTRFPGTNWLHGSCSLSLSSRLHSGFAL